MYDKIHYKLKKKKKLGPADFKRNAQHESCEFCLGRNEDYSPRELGSWYNLLKTSDYPKICSASFSQGTESLIPDLYSVLFIDSVEGQQLQQLMV